MKVALLGDIHGNIEALDAVIKVLERDRPDAIYHVGDIVGYCTDFEKVIRLLLHNNIPGVIGNHELMVTGELDSERCVARDSIRWTADRIAEKDLEYIKSLPSRLRISNIVIFHAVPESYTDYVTNEERAGQVCEELDRSEPGWRIAFHGHTHKQRIFERKAGSVRLVLEGEGKFRLNQGCQYVVCPGSVGVSRDLEPKTAYMIYEDEQIHQYRMKYDWKGCQKKLDQAGLKTRLFVKRRSIIRRLMARI